MEQIEDLRVRGNSLFNKKIYGEAITAYTQALNSLEIQCNDDATILRATLLSNRSVAFYRLGDYTHSLEDAETALELDNVSPKALYRAAVACLMLAQPAKACRHLQTLCSPSLIKTAPENATELLSHAEKLLAHQELVSRINNKPNNQPETEPLAASSTATGIATLEQVEQVEQALRELTEDIEGDSDADVFSCLAALETSLADSAECRALFEAKNGYRLVWYFFSESSYSSAAGVLRSAATTAVLWPATTWQRLLHFALGNEGTVLAAEAMELVRWAAHSSPAWVMQHVLTHPLPSSDNNNTSNSSTPLIPLQDLVEALHSASASTPQRAYGIGCNVCISISHLLGLYSSAPGGVSALRALACQPLHALLTAFIDAEDLVASERENLSRETKAPLTSQAAENTAPSSSPSSTLSQTTLSQREDDALQELLAKQRAVYDVRLVSLQRALLCALRMLCSSKELIMDEAVVVRSIHTKGGAMKTKTEGGLLVPSVLSMLSSLVERAPQRTTPVLGPDGYPAAYKKKRFAADFVDNPAGDFLATLDLSRGSSSGGGGGGASSRAAQAQVSEEGTLLEIALDIALAVCICSPSTATLAFRNGVLSLCQKLCEFSTPVIVEFGQKLCAAVCDGCPAAWEEALQESSVVSLAGLVRYSKQHSKVAAALDKLASQVDACSGDDFAALTGIDAGVVVLAVQLAAQPEHAEHACEKEPAVKEPATRVVKMCAERSARIQNKPKGSCPSGGGWALVDRTQLESILRPAVHPRAAAAAAHAGLESDPDEGLQKLKKGFFNVAATPKGLDQSTRQSDSDRKSNVVYTSGSVVIEDITEEEERKEESKNGPAKEFSKIQPVPQVNSDTTSTSATTTTTTTTNHNNKEENDDDDDDIPELRDVYDSTPTDAGIRSARAAWLSIPPNNRVRWSQTSTDVSAWFKVPLGTGAREITVDVAPGTLSVGVGWFGRVGEGALYAGVKARESTWCLEDDEVHVVLPKDGAGQWWKALFTGGEEKGYYELLQDAVDADEPAEQYDDMDPAAKDLLDSILERQAYVNAGLIDLENGFDDFRIVLGESSLGLPQGKGNDNSGGGGSGK